MGRRSKIAMLPAEVRDELDRRLVKGNFANHQALADWLSEQGFEISRPAVQRHSQRFDAYLKTLKLATDEARTIVTTAPDDEGAVNDALVRLVQSKLHNLLIEVDMDEPNLARIARAVADLGRTSVTQKKWSREVRERLEAQKAIADQKIRGIAKEGGLSDDAEARIRKVLFEINPMRPMTHETAVAIRTAVLEAPSE
jgi:hypothetical protein